MDVTYKRILITVVGEKPIVLLDQVLNDLALVRHVIDHVGHVVLRGSDERGAKHDRQVTRLHLSRGGEDKTSFDDIRRLADDFNPHSSCSRSYLVLFTVVRNPLEVSAQEFQSFKMMIG